MHGRATTTRDITQCAAQAATRPVGHPTPARRARNPARTTLATSLLGVSFAVSLSACGASPRVSSETALRAKGEFDAVVARHDALNKTLRKRLLGITASKLKPDAKVAFRRQALKKHATESRKVLAAYVQVAESVPRGKTAHTWVYASLVRGAQVFAELGQLATQLAQDPEGAPDDRAHFTAIARSANRGAYASYMRVLFLAHHDRGVDPTDPTHHLSGNVWLERANTRRCGLSRAEKLTQTEHDNLVWGMFKAATPSRLHATPAELRGQLMIFMKVPAHGHCSP